MAEKENKKDDVKYFYLIIFITLVIAGVALWQAFFVGDLYVTEPDESYKNIPELDLVFFDSTAFQRLDEFDLKDDPLAPSGMDLRNPFELPNIPEDSELKIWWGLSTFRVEEGEDGWIFNHPQEISEEDNPELILFEDRWYAFRFSEKEMDFEIRDSTGSALASLGEDDLLEFRADSDMESYGNNDFQGEVTVVPEGRELTDEDIERERAEDILFEASSELTSLHNTISIRSSRLGEERVEQLREEHSEFASRYSQKQDEYYDEGADGDEFEERVGALIEEIEQKILSIEEETEDGDEELDENEDIDEEEFEEEFEEELDEEETEDGDEEEFEEAENNEGEIEEEN